MVVSEAVQRVHSAASVRQAETQQQQQQQLLKVHASSNWHPSIASRLTLNAPLVKLSQLVKRNREAPPISISEAEAFLQEAEENEDQAVQQLRTKDAWRKSLGKVSIREVAPFYRSEGYSICLEGLTDKQGNPLIYSNGIPHGSVDEVVRQVTYTQERAMAQCIRRRRPLKCTTIVNVRNPTFRMPDQACKAAIEVNRKYYPWGSRGKTLFVGFPAPVRFTFKLLRPFMSAEQYNSIAFAEIDELPRFIDVSNLPPALGGSAKWDMEGYIRKRGAEERVRPSSETRPYRGKRLDVAQLDAMQSQGTATA